MFNTVREMIEVIENRRSYRKDREALNAFLYEIGNPHLAIRTIHVAGTNGKGSTTNYISHILMAQGYQVGMFTSPYLVSHFDRIRVNNKEIPGKQMLTLVNRYWDLIEQYDLNMFEIDFAMSAVYFMENDVDFAIYEVGMGGRLDATNAVMPLVCGITNIGMDHMTYLGDTYAKIALEKAGIMKKGIKCFTTEKKEECLRVLRTHSKDVQADLVEVEYLPVVSYPPLKVASSIGTLNLGEVALYQSENAALAIAMVKSLEEVGVIIQNDAIKKGVKALWKGRFEKVKEHLYLDGAHNIEGVNALCQSIDAIKGDRKVRVIFSCLKDKPMQAMIDVLANHADILQFTTFDNPRAALKEDYPSDYDFIEQYQEAFEKAQEASNEEVVFITGSLYFITLAKQYFN